MLRLTHWGKAPLRILPSPVLRRLTMLKLSIPSITIAIVLFCAVGGCQSTDTPSPETNRTSSRIDIANHSEEFSLGRHIELFEDTSAQMKFEDVRRQATAESFRLSEWDSPSFGLTSSAWWTRFTLTNSASTTRHIILRQDYPLIDHLDVWIEGAAQMEHHRTGDLLPFDARMVEHRDFLFPMELPAHSELSVWMRLQSAGSMTISLSVYPTSAFIKTLSTEQLLLGVYFGGFIVLMLYNLFMFAGTTDRTFLYYVLFVASYAACMAIQNGLAFQYFWPKSPHWGQSSMLVLTLSNQFWALLFSMKFLRVRVHAHGLWKICRASQITVGVLAPVVLFVPYEIGVRVVMVSTLVVTVLIFVLGAKVLRTGYRPARFFMLAWVSMLVGIGIYVFRSMGVLPHTFVTNHGIQIGSIIEMILLSMALADRINEFERQSLSDQMTGLSNRRFFDLQFARSFAEAKRYGLQLSLLIVDIDFFKRFNDNYGHAEGDTVLKAVAHQLAERVRRTDYACRYGGEEFVVLLPHTDSQGAAHLAEQVRAGVEELKVNGRRVTVSIGISTHKPDSSTTQDALFKAADAALYAAKEAGRNSCKLGEPASDVSATDEPEGPAKELSFS